MAGADARIFANIDAPLQLGLHSVPFVSEPRTTMADPVHVVDPPAAPEPDPGCDVCRALARERQEAAGSGNWSTVTDCNVELRRHRREHP